jgi:hypothetical protein
MKMYDSEFFCRSAMGKISFRNEKEQRVLITVRKHGKKNTPSRFYN